MTTRDRAPGDSIKIDATPRESREPIAVQRILCATDLTTRSENAVRRATLLAKQLNAEILFVHAVGETHAGRVLRMKIARSQAQLLSLAERAKKEGACGADVSVSVGSPIQAIVTTANDWKPDMIVMARPRHHRLDAVIGTTAERVIRATHRSVLLVSPRGVTPYRNVVLATDLTKTSIRVARIAAAIGVLKDAYTWIVHAFAPPYHGLVPVDVEEQIAAHRRHWRGVLSRELLQKLSLEGIDLSRVEVVVEAARPCDAIEQAIQESGSELVIIGTSRWFTLKRMVFGSVADQIFRRLPCDILAISARAQTQQHAASRIGTASRLPSRLSAATSPGALST